MDALVSALLGSLEWLARYEIYVYGVMAVGAAWCVYGIVQAARRLEDTPFGLERAEAEQTRTQAVVGLAALAILAGGLFWSTRYGMLTLSGSVVIPPTPTLVLTPTPITDGGAIAVDSSGCNETLIISQPADGTLINTTYEILGTVNTPNLAFYKLELSGAATNGNWVTITVNTTPVMNGVLLPSFSPNPYTPGNYAMRLIAFDNDGNSAPPCAVAVSLDRPGQPTAPPVP